MNKICPSCKIEKPENEFYKNKGRKDGLSTFCKVCIADKYGKREHHVVPKTKICAKCKKIKSIHDFYIKSSQKDGHTARCKECISDDSSEYYQINKEKVYERSKEWIQKNREYVRERDRKYRKEHLEQDKAKDKRYRDSHKEKLAEKGKRYRETHKDYFYNKARERKNSQLLRSDGTVTLEAEQKLLKTQNNLCDYCGDDISKKKHLDHILPLDRGGMHTIDNVHFTCPSCNLSKGTKTEDEWFEWLKIHRKQKYEKIMKYKQVKEIEKNLYDQCKSCGNKWSSFECDVCEDFDMYKEID